MIKSTNVLIEARNLSKRFSGLVALDSVSFHLFCGERLGIIGVNGSGKTTILNILSRLIEPDAGDLIYKGKSYLKYKPYHLIRLGFARSFQYTRNWKNMSISDNLITIPESFTKFNYSDCLVNRKYQKNLDNKILHSANQIINLLDSTLLNDSNKLVGDLSIGQQRIIELTRILLMNPKVLLLDEPSVGLSSNAINQFSKYLKQYTKEGNGALFVSHDLQFMKENADRILCLSEGKIISQGKYEDVINNLNVKEAYLGRTE